MLNAIDLWKTNELIFSAIHNVNNSIEHYTTMLLLDLIYIMIFVLKTWLQFLDDDSWHGPESPVRIPNRFSVGGTTVIKVTELQAGDSPGIPLKVIVFWVAFAVFVMASEFSLWYVHSMVSFLRRLYGPPRFPWTRLHIRPPYPSFVVPYSYVSSSPRPYDNDVKILRQIGKSWRPECHGER